MPGLHGGDRTQNALRDAREAQDPGLTEADDAATALVTSAEVDSSSTSEDLEGDQADSEEDASAKKSRRGRG